MLRLAGEDSASQRRAPSGRIQLARSRGHSRPPVVPASSLFLSLHLRPLGISRANRSRGKARLEIGGAASSAAGKGRAEKHQIAALRAIFLGEEQTMTGPNYFRALAILLCSLSAISWAAAQATPPAKPRARDLGVPFDGTPGPLNAITDVSGVTVGHTTLISGEGKLQVGKGPVRTGVTAVLPRGKDSMNNPVFAGWWSLNGNGEMTGTTWVEESGFLEGPVMITNTHSVGVVPVGREIPEDPAYASASFNELDRGSIIVVVATDAPLLAHQLKRLARRVSLGLGRDGSISGNGSGDIFIAFSTANPGAAGTDDVVNLQMLPNDQIEPVFAATVQATEEAVINAMVAAETMTGIENHKVIALPHEKLREVLKKYNRLTP